LTKNRQASAAKRQKGKTTDGPAKKGGDVLKAWEKKKPAVYLFVTRTMNWREAAMVKSIHHSIRGGEMWGKKSWLRGERKPKGLKKKPSSAGEGPTPLRAVTVERFN